MTFFLISLSGAGGSGKDTIAQELQKTYGIRPMSLAEPLKAMASEITGLTVEQVNQVKDGLLMPEKMAGMRRMLQLLGTEVGRRCWDEDVWVKHLLRRVEAQKRISGTSGPYGVVITDVRFRNEFNALRAAGFLMIDVQAPTEFLRIKPPENGHTPFDGCCPYHHASERDLDGYRAAEKFNLTLFNDRVNPIPLLARLVMEECSGGLVV